MIGNRSRVVVVLLSAGMAGAALAGGLPTQRDDLDTQDLARVRAVTAPTTDFSKAEAFEAMPGGAATTKKLINRDIFSQSSANLTFEQERDFKLGNALFRKLWVSSPSSTQASDGLGPLYNARSCQACHLKDGRGHPPRAGEGASSMFLRLARAPETAEERAAVEDYLALNMPDPVYGEQLQEFAVPGLKAEGRLAIAYEETPVTLAGGEIVSLRKPSYSVDNLGYGPLHPATTLSPRVAPPMIGLGLLEAIPEARILALSTGPAVPHPVDRSYAAAFEAQVAALIASPRDAALVDIANRYLARIRDHAGADEVYVLDSDGTTLAASNWDEGTSFVGQNYRFRSYFKDAMATVGKSDHASFSPRKDQAEKWGAKRIDYILTSPDMNDRLIDAGLFEHEQAAIGSDHYMMTADYRLK